ncbi:hypothetical protein NW762_012463 [Fusarium torreyae]|uniref:Nephrocystin 3-like N-terminal domain-containing protein n=1 Tax=Fusarium torreyae TaxID=1237075 RepID=A0A9W8RMJ7_9HYPO|nr:hypothetical protein NW762_012463 [Fusarium torreyae]
MERMEGQSEANQGNQYSHIQVAGGRNILGNVTNIESEDPLRHLPYASGGPSNSYSRQHDPRCLPGTRVDLLQEIDEWAKTHDQRFLYWLSGWAGTGKTTIALTISDNVQKHGRLGASFFFSKGGGDVSHAGRFVTSIALQLAQNVPDLREHIKRVLRKRINISSESLREQWLHLVIHPLMTLNYIESVSHPWILVVDALDECDDNNNIVMIVQLLAELQTLGKPPLRVLLTSRPQTRIKDTLAQMMDFTLHETVLHDISPDTVNGDIIRFLGHKLRLIRETGVENDDWPGDQAIAQLAQHAANLFIWASTACSFIEDGPIPDESLQLLLQGAAEIGDEASPEEHLDAIYRTVLRSAIQSNWTVRKKAGLLDLLKHVLGSIVTLFAPLALEPLSKLIDTPKPKVELVTKDLRAILDIPKSQDFPLRLHHPSFRDFLLVQDRCQDPDFHVDERQAHQKLAGRCFQVMSEALGQDICGVGSPDAAATDVSTEFVDQHITAEAQYACLYWTRHVCESGILLQDDGIVHEFLKTYLLCWLEALSWLRRVSDSIQAISSLQTIIPISEECLPIIVQLSD